MKYLHLFFDLDHTLWDYYANARLALMDMYKMNGLEKKGVHDFDLFYAGYTKHNDKLWEKFRAGHIKSAELRWKRMHLALLDFRIGDEALANLMGEQFMELLPGYNHLFPDTIHTLSYLTGKGYQLHLITNGFENTQHHKIKNSGIAKFFVEVITSESSNSIKPQKAIFDFALAKAKALPGNSIMIGDSIEVDIIGAKNAGIDQVFMNHTNIVTDVVPTYTVRSMKELETIF
jgi:putative hydrolase of the HAD superfamily